MRIRQDIVVPHMPMRGDRYAIKFALLTYKVLIHRRYVETLGHTNRAILLTMFGGDYRSILANAYGYIPGDGDWPVYNADDYCAVARVFQEFEKRGAIITYG